MDITLIAFVLGLAAWALKRHYQGARIRLLATHLGPLGIEPLIACLHEQYFRALDESDPARAAQIWALQANTEAELLGKLQLFAQAFDQVYLAKTQVFKLPLALPYADQLFPALCFDARRAFAIHAEGVALAMACRLPAPARARRILAELYLLQHTCHWFCRSLPTASARLLARHQTSHAQVLQAVSPDTQRAYTDLIARKPSHTSG